ncbi:MAG TPA: murein biosynthesis integral membrane protein MurJ [Candidatus Parcubacteria bacterium]|nr:murein biosynthesis integral membrane protein MurJ [Parcubacteria group bacterium]HJN62315.1 murein biosynthesis integral membrane protein MurJ [Candidatus Parcubacteria bacterium]|tara:strand:- start:42656 stop:44281 length:1626 start_codon:yes stop_codon:yes gene_type:complete
MINRIFNSQTKTITFAAILLGFSALGSRILGLIRDRLLAGSFGAGPELDIYFAAFRIPDFVYGILIIGGISSVFLPVFSEYFRKEQSEGWQLANNVLHVFFALLILVSGILIIFTPWIIKLIAPGFTEEQRALTVVLSRIMFLSPIILGLSSVFSSVLHYFNRFLIYSLAPILYNIGIILGILFFVPVFGLLGLAYGVILGALLHLIIQIPAVWISGFRWRPIFNFKQEGLIQIFRLMIPRTIGQASYHINLIVITAIASTLAAGSIAIFNFSYNLQYFPIGLIGISFALASFPTLSRAWAEGNKEKFLSDFSLAFRQILFLVIPASILIFLLRAQIVRLILGTGQFGWLETRLTAASLGLFALGIFAASLIPFLSRAFFSLKDTKTPVIIGMVSISLNVFLSLFFVWILRFENVFSGFVINILKLESIQEIAVIGLPLALSLSAIFQFFLLLIFLKKKIVEMSFIEVKRSLIKIFTASLLMAVIVYFLLKIAANFVDMQTFLGVLLQSSLAAFIGLSVYFISALVLGSPEIKTILSSIKK